MYIISRVAPIEAAGPEGADGEEGDRDEPGGDPEYWGSKWEFICSCVGYSVGIGNVWRFPTLAFENGGGSFFIAYIILLILIGKPLYYLELSLGQFSQSGPLEVWRLCPVGTGIGAAQILVSLLVCIYYNIIMCYCFYFIFASFQSVVPWSRCSDDWFQGVGADERCYERGSGTGNRSCDADTGSCETASEQYFRRAVLGIHRAKLQNVSETAIINGTQVESFKIYALTEEANIGDIKWDLALCNLLSWIIVFACLYKGIKGSGKVVYVTSTLPYVLLLVLLVYGCTLEGAMDGITAFFVPRTWTGKNSLADPQVWRKAGEQMFYSLGICWGGLVMFGRYNKFKHKVPYSIYIFT